MKQILSVMEENHMLNSKIAHLAIDKEIEMAIVVDISLVKWINMVIMLVNPILLWWLYHD